MIISFEKQIDSDLDFLKSARLQNFKNVSLEKVIELTKNKIEFKKTLKGTSSYSSLKGLLNELRQSKLPFRILATIKQCFKENRCLPPHLQKSLEESNIAIPQAKSERQALLEKLLQLGLPHSQILSIVEQLHWLHGTNSALLPCLKGSNYTLLSSGKLLDIGVAPMCGELAKGGMTRNGINQQWISVETIRNVKRCWEYAAKTSHSFNPEIFDEAEIFFCEKLSQFKEISANNNDWDLCIIHLLQLKQWSPEIFEKMQEKYAAQIEETILAATEKLFYKEALVLKALNYPEEELKKAVYNKPTRGKIENEFQEVFNSIILMNGFWSEEVKDYEAISFFKQWRNPQFIFNSYRFLDCDDWKYIISNVFRLRLFYNNYLIFLKNSKSPIAQIFSQALEEKYSHISQFLKHYVKDRIDQRINELSFSSGKRLLRLKNVFDQKQKIQFSQEQKEMITSPFPILIGSTKTKGFFLNGDKEANIASAKFGDEVDTLFVQNKDLPSLNCWLKEEGLNDKICVHTWESIAQLPIPLYHTTNDVIGENAVLKPTDYQFIHKNIQKLLPMYQIKEFEHHGVPHATRAAFFAAIVTEMYLAQGYTPTVKPQYLPITGFAHDTGRENDFGEDLWDEKSGKICEEFMTKELELGGEEAQILFKSISEKEKESSISFEQKIIHDADCIEFFRCLKNSDVFERERLWMFQDQFPEPLLSLFIEEAKELIILTEIPIIKKSFEESTDPWCFLMQLIDISGAFPFLKTYALNSIDLFKVQSNYLLTLEVEKAIDMHLKEKK